MVVHDIVVHDTDRSGDSPVYVSNCVRIFLGAICARCEPFWRSRTGSSRYSNKGVGQFPLESRLESVFDHLT